MNTVSGLQTALKLCGSDKIKDRSQGQEHVREIFSNRENLIVFQETASKDGGAGWVAFFQCLFQVVVVEKKAAVKKGASVQGESESRFSGNQAIEKGVREVCRRGAQIIGWGSDSNYRKG